MKKSVFAILSVAMLLAFTSARYTAPSDARVGSEAPELVLSEGSGSTLELQSYRGQYVLLTFWSSSDVDSRLSNLRYSRALCAGSKVRHVSMNFDSSEGVYHQTLVADCLPASSQYHCSDVKTREQVLRRWRQSADNLSSLLIAPDGRIASINPTLDELSVL